jgi:hypothetical protein
MQGRVLNFSAANLLTKSVEGAADEGIASTIRFINCANCPVLQRVFRDVNDFNIFHQTTSITLQSDGFEWVLTKTNYFLYRTYD